MDVPPDGLFQNACFDFVELGKIEIEHDLLAAQLVDPLLNSVQLHRVLFNVIPIAGKCPV